MDPIYFTDEKAGEPRPKPVVVVDSADFAKDAGKWIEKAKDSSLAIRGKDGEVSITMCLRGEGPRIASGVVLPDARVVVLTLKSHRIIVAPFSDFAPGARGPGGTATSVLANPDFSKPEIRDWGYTLGLGEFEASLDAIIADADARAARKPEAGPDADGEARRARAAMLRRRIDEIVAKTEGDEVHLNVAGGIPERSSCGKPGEASRDVLKVTCRECLPCEHALDFVKEARGLESARVVTLEQVHCHVCSGIWKLPR